jgi:hypothetical protein
MLHTSERAWLQLGVHLILRIMLAAYGAVGVGMPAMLYVLAGGMVQLRTFQEALLVRQGSTSSTPPVRLASPPTAQQHGQKLKKGARHPPCPQPSNTYVTCR